MQFLEDEIYRELLRAFNLWCRRRALLVFLYGVSVLRLPEIKPEQFKAFSKSEGRDGEEEEKDYWEEKKQGGYDEDYKTEGKDPEYFGEDDKRTDGWSFRRVLQNRDMLKSILEFL